MFIGGVGGLAGQARRVYLLLLPILAVLLSVPLPHHDGHGRPLAGFEPAQLNSGDLPVSAGREPLDSHPAVKRGVSVMAAAESSRRKLRTPQRPAVEPLGLSACFSARGRPGTSCLSRPRSAPAPRLARASLPFPARGPPAGSVA